MSITLNPDIYRFSAMRSVRFAAEKDKNKAAVPSAGRDQVIISRQGRDYLEDLADITAEQLGTMTKDDFMDMIRQWQSENQTKLETDPYWKADPDGSIANKTYFESYIGQLIENEDTIRRYYEEAYNEAVSAPVNSLTYITGKYLLKQSEYFDASIPRKEREWAYHQLWAMLTDSNVALNDPYALASSGGTKTSEEMDKIARQAVKDKLDALIKERETASEQ